MNLSILGLGFGVLLAASACSGDDDDSTVPGSGGKGGTSAGKSGSSAGGATSGKAGTGSGGKGGNAGLGAGGKGGAGGKAGAGGKGGAGGSAGCFVDACNPGGTAGTDAQGGAGAGSGGAAGADAGAAGASVGSPPTATINHPGDGEMRDAADTIPFIGVGTDPEDGALTGSALVWTSDLTGAIGTGESFDGTLTAGMHVVTLTVTDSDGNQATDSISLDIQ